MSFDPVIQGKSENNLFETRSRSCFSWPYIFVIAELNLPSFKQKYIFSFNDLYKKLNFVYRLLIMTYSDLSEGVFISFMDLKTKSFLKKI